MTTNLSLSQWAKFITDAQANAILDRLVHHSVCIQIIGKPYRMMDYYRSQTRKD
ncbi:MAG: ATP-binding protein [Weissella confusa]|nr:ATP-binding protein [Weissella confusa]